MERVRRIRWCFKCRPESETPGVGILWLTDVSLSDACAPAVLCAAETAAVLPQSANPVMASRGVSSS